MHTEGHDMGKDAVGGTPPAAQAPKFDAEHPGYETTDVRVGGIAVFLAGLFGFVLVFFFFCYGMGIVINSNLGMIVDGKWKKDEPPTKWAVEAGATPPGQKRQDLASNPEMEQKELARMTTSFPEPRLDIDDGNQATADLHAKEDLLLDHYSVVDGQPGTVRIPIERAMELIAQRGLPLAGGATAGKTQTASTETPGVQAPLTTGFARTGYEYTTIEAREQKMNYGKAEAAANAEPAPAK
jgi:hypothetical protein